MNLVTFIFMLISFFLTFILTGICVKRFRFLGKVSSDLHKNEKPKKPKSGGVAIAINFFLMMVFFYIYFDSLMFLVILFAFLVSASVGLLDDSLGFKPPQKMILASLAAVPLLWIVSWEISIVLAVFLGVAIVSNWTNMLAGFNGLEVGLGFIVCFFLALSTQTETVSLVLFIYAAALFAFLFFNRYPAKIFPGDVGTLPIGVVLVSTVLFGAPFLKLLILLIPFFLDACLKLLSVGIISSADIKPSYVDDEGFLVPQKNYLSLSTLIMRIKKVREWQLVLSIWTFEIILGVITLIS